jgi:hypothetical protein
MEPVENLRQLGNKMGDSKKGRNSEIEEEKNVIYQGSKRILDG